MENNLRLICIAIVMQPANGGQPVANSPWGETAPQPQVTNQPPQPQVMHQAPQPMMMGSVNHQMNQGASPFNIPVQYQQSYKKIHANDWFIMGIVSCIFGFMGPGVCWLISLVGVISMATKLNIENTQPGHPEADKVKSALIVNVIALILPIVVMIVLISSGF
jgi:hypothetical protein